MVIDLKKEQAATLSRGSMAYSRFTRLLFWGMDVFYGTQLTFGKMRLLEILARIPYQAWEIKQYHRMNSQFSDPAAVESAEDIIRWGRDAQDNEFWHLKVINNRIERDGIRLNWFKDRFVPRVTAFKYGVFCRFLALVCIETAFKLNAEFEDHAEHAYMGFVKNHPELDDQPFDTEKPSAYKDLNNWGDVFRRMGLDERDHMNNSLLRCGRENEMAPHVSQG